MATTQVSKSFPSNLFAFLLSLCKNHTLYAVFLLIATLFVLVSITVLSVVVVRKLVQRFNNRKVVDVETQAGTADTKDIESSNLSSHVCDNFCICKQIGRPTYDWTPYSPASSDSFSSTTLTIPRLAHLKDDYSQNTLNDPLPSPVFPSEGAWWMKRPGLDRNASSYDSSLSTPTLAYPSLLHLKADETQESINTRFDHMLSPVTPGEEAWWTKLPRVDVGSSSSASTPTLACPSPLNAKDSFDQETVIKNLEDMLAPLSPDDGEWWTRLPHVESFSSSESLSSSTSDEDTNLGKKDGKIRMSFTNAGDATWWTKLPGVDASTVNSLSASDTLAHLKSPPSPKTPQLHQAPVMKHSVSSSAVSVTYGSVVATPVTVVEPGVGTSAAIVDFASIQDLLDAFPSVPRHNEEWWSAHRDF